MNYKLISKTVLEMQSCNFLRGGYLAIPFLWFSRVTYDVTDAKPNLLPHMPALIVLADAIFWYTPVPVYYPDTHPRCGKLKCFCQQFQYDKLWIRYAGYARFGLTEKQARDGLAKLVSLNLVFVEKRPVNRLFLDLNLFEIVKLSFFSDSSDLEDRSSDLEDRHQNILQKYTQNRSQKHTQTRVPVDNFGDNSNVVVDSPEKKEGEVGLSQEELIIRTQMLGMLGIDNRGGMLEKMIFDFEKYPTWKLNQAVDHKSCNSNLGPGLYVDFLNGKKELFFNGSGKHEKTFIEEARELGIVLG